MAHYLDSYLASLKDTHEANRLVHEDWAEEANYKKEAWKRAEAIVAKLAEGLKRTEQSIKDTEEIIKNESK